MKFINCLQTFAIFIRFLISSEDLNAQEYEDSDFMADMVTHSVPLSSWTPAMKKQIHKETMSQVERRELAMPKSTVALMYTANVELHCSVSPGVTKVIWTVEKGVGLSLTGTVYDNGRLMPNWDVFYMINKTLPGQNTLVILNTTMGIAGTYRCATAYPGSELSSHFAELVVVSIEHSLGTVFSPIMFFKWMIKYCGNMQPHVLCSNGELLAGVQSQVRVRENMIRTVVFSSCFFPERLPMRCSVLFKDKNDQSVNFRTFDVRLIDVHRRVARNSSLNLNDNMLIRGPMDKVIRGNRSLNIEFSCDVHPPPDYFFWSFLDYDNRCYGFLEKKRQSTSFPAPTIKYRLRNRFRDVSQLDLIDVGEEAAGQYRCIVTYQTIPIQRRTFTGELVVVLETNNFVTMATRGARVGERTATISFRVIYRGNMLPRLICGNHNLRPTDIEERSGTREAFFNETLVVALIPVLCKLNFENPLSKKKVHYEEIYVRRITDHGPTKGTKVPAGLKTPGRKIDDIHSSRVQTPKNVVARENTRNVVLHCVTDEDAVTVTWDFDGVLPTAYSGLIYQNGKPLPKNVLTSYRVNTSELGQHSLIILEVRSRMAGTYGCSVRYKNVTDRLYKAELVLVTVEEPMTIELLPPGQKWQAFFHCMISYHGRMHPFLRCADLSQNMGNKLTTRPGLASVVVFEKYLNLSAFPYSCEIHFRNTKGETSLFEAGQTVLASRLLQAGTEKSGDKPDATLALFCIFAITRLLLN